MLLTSHVRPDRDLAMPWTNITRFTKAVLAMAKPVLRNRRISSEYAEIYLWTRELRWAGLAAFASKQVGCVLRSLVMKPAHPQLIDGNRAVFAEIYPALRFYSLQKGRVSDQDIINGLRTNSSVPSEITKAFQYLLRDPSDPDIVKDAARIMLRYEQEKTLQKKVYDNHHFRRLLRLGRIVRINLVVLHLSVRCRATDPSFIVPFTGAKLEDFQDRWIFASECAERFDDLVDSPATHVQIDDSLADIAAGV